MNQETRTENRRACIMELSRCARTLGIRQKPATRLALEQTLQRRSHSPIGESRGATCGTLSGKPILGTLFGARRKVVGDRPV